MRRGLDELAGQGSTVEAVRARVVDVAERLGDLTGACAAVQDILHGYATALDDVQHRARRLREAEADTRQVEVSLSDPWRYWQVHADLTLAHDSPTSPAQVEQAMIQLLREDDWTEDDRNDAISGTATFRKQDLGGVWTVQIGSWNDPPPAPQAVYFWVVSPTVDH